MKKTILSLSLLGMACGTTLAQEWHTTGNAGTNGATHYVGTQDEHPLIFRTDDAERMRIDSTNGFVGIGTDKPLFHLSVNGVSSPAHRTISINDTPVVYLPDQSPAVNYGSIAIGNGLRLSSVAHTSGSLEYTRNTAVGIDALLKNTFGSSNVAMGSCALKSNTEGFNNTAIGANALDSNTTGAQNVAFGVGALGRNKTGSGNMAIGTGALSGNNGSNNVAVGIRSMQISATAQFNTAVGGRSLSTSSSGSYNTALGFNANAIGLLKDSLFNATAIGANAMIGKSNAMSLGDTTKLTLVGIGTAYPDYQLDVRAAANPARMRGLQNGRQSDYIVTDSAGILRHIPLSSVGSSLSADEGLTLANNVIMLGDECGRDGAPFQHDRQINMDHYNLYFHSGSRPPEMRPASLGKIFMGESNCQTLTTRLEISAKGLRTYNGYEPEGAPSGLRFSNLTATDEPIENRYKGVLSLDEDGDVIWVADRTGTDGGGLINTCATTNMVPKLTGTNTYGCSQIFDNGTHVGIGTTNPLFRLDISAAASSAISERTIAISGMPVTFYIPDNRSLAIGNGLRNNNSYAGENTSLGIDALVNNTTGYHNTASGFQALKSNTTGSANTVLGWRSLELNTTGGANTAIGFWNLPVMTSGNSNTALGNSVMMHLNTGHNNVGIGTAALLDMVTGNQNTGIGLYAGIGQTAGNDNIFIGYNTLPNVSPTASNQLNIGNWIYGNNGKIGIGWGTGNPTARLHVNAADGVRFQNLPTGTGNVVVIDANGNLYRAAATAAMPAPDSQEAEDMKNTVEELKKEIAELKKSLNELKQTTTVHETTWKADGAQHTLFQNVPNPSDKSTRIEYTLNQECKDAYIAIFDMNGKMLNRIAVAAVPGKGAVQMDIAAFAAGTYPYALFVNGVKQDSKTMQIIR